MIDVEIQGLDDLNRALMNVVNKLNPDKVEPVLFNGAKIITQAAKAKAPQSSDLNPDGPTGRLKKAIRTKKLRRYGNKPAPAISAVDRKKAPHAHLVEYGTGPRYGKKGTKAYIGKYFGVMPSKPFMRPAVDEKKTDVIRYVVTKLKQLAKEAGRS